MKKISVLIVFAGILSALCLMFSSPSNWLFYAIFLLLIGAALLVFSKHRSFWLVTICFSVYTIFAIWGILEKSNAFFVISGQLFAFTAWDLLVFKNELKGDLNNPVINQLLNHHMRVLFPVTGMAWFISLLFLNVQFKLPFLLILFAGSLGIFGFFRFFRISAKQ